MLKPLWCDGAFPHRGQRFRPGFNSAPETAATVTALIGIAISPITRRRHRRSDGSVDTEHVFGFNEGADIGSKGECRQRGISRYGAEQPRRRERRSRELRTTPGQVGISGLNSEPKFDLPSREIGKCTR